MPPKKDKKKDAEVEMVAYDIDTMTTSELREYAYMLEKDIETIRGYCSFYQQTEDELASIYKMRQEDLSQKNDTILSKDIEMEKLRLKVQQKIEEKRQWPMYNEFANEERKQQEAAEAASGLEKALKRNQEQQVLLKAEIHERERKLEEGSKEIQIDRRAALEKNYKKQKDMDEYERNLLERSVKSFLEMLSEADQLNRLTMKSIEAEALEGKRMVDQEFHKVCMSYRQKLHDYYKNITKQDLDAIKELTRKAKDLESSIEFSRSRLRSLQQQNEALLANRHQKATPRYKPSRSTMTSKAGMRKDKKKKMEELENENQILEGKIHALLEETDNLRREFAQALYKVRQSADMKGKLLNKRLNSVPQSNSGRGS